MGESAAILWDKNRVFCKNVSIFSLKFYAHNNKAPLSLTEKRASLAFEIGILPVIFALEPSSAGGSSRAMKSTLKQESVFYRPYGSCQAYSNS